MNERLPSAESRETPKIVLYYLRNKQATIMNDYRASDGRYSEHCGLIAIDIAKLSEDVREDSIIHSKTLVPTIYEGRITWGAHQVCCCDGQVFDLILDRPVAVENYTKNVFWRGC